MSQRDFPPSPQDASEDGSLRPALFDRGHSASAQVKIIWAIVAGTVFALIRFFLVWPLMSDFNRFTGHNLPEEVFWLPWIAAPCAGLSGAVLWWLLGGRQSFLIRGAMVGLLAALFSYFGIAVFVALFSDPAYLIIAPLATVWFVFPVLIVVGVLLGLVQNKLTHG